MKRVILIACCLIIGGCGFGEYQKKLREKENNAIELVKSHEGSTAKTTTESIGLVAAIASAAGHKIEIVGWGADTDLKSDAITVRFQIKDNGNTEEFRWAVSKEGKVSAVNELATKVTKQN